MRVLKEEVQARLDALGTGITLGDNYVNMTVKCDFICRLGHVWQARPSHVSSGTSGCAECAGTVRRTLKLVQERIAPRGIKVLSQELNDQPGGKTLFKCPQGHAWRTNYKNVDSKTSPTGCTVCTELSRGKTRLVPVEEQQRKLDDQKRGIRIVGEYVNASTPVEFECQYGHRWTTTSNSVVTNGTGCPRCARGASLVESEVREKLAEKRIEMTGPMVRAIERTAFRCRVCGHNWRSRLSSVVHTSGCPECGKKKAAASRRLSLADLQARLARQGIELIGDYKSVDIPAPLRCFAQGHEWSANPSGYVNGPNPLGCPHCSNRALLTKEEVNRRITDRGLVLSGGYENSQTSAWFRCDKGHRWKALPNSVMRGSGCPACTSYGTTADTVYLWKTDQLFNHQPVYKMGITSWHAKQDRVDFVAEKAGFKSELVERIFVGAGKGYEVERLILEIGSDPQYVGIDGHSEFRALNPKQFEAVLAVMREHEIDLNELVERTTTPNQDIYSEEVLEMENEDGRIFAGTRIQIAESLQIRHYAIRQMVDGKRWTSNGWGLAGWKRRQQNIKEQRKSTATLYHRDGRAITGNTRELAEAIGVKEKLVIELLTSDAYSVKDWGETSDWYELREAKRRKGMMKVTLYDAEGKQWSGTRAEAAEQLGLKSSFLSQVLRGHLVSALGWGLTPEWPEEKERRRVGRLARHRVRSPDGEEITANGEDLMRDYGLTKSWVDRHRKKRGVPDRKGWVYLGQVEAESQTEVE